MHHARTISVGDEIKQPARVINDWGGGNHGPVRAASALRHSIKNRLVAIRRHAHQGNALVPDGAQTIDVVFEIGTGGSPGGDPGVPGVERCSGSGVHGMELSAPTAGHHPIRSTHKQ